jgi:hypothetical protein
MLQTKLELLLCFAPLLSGKILCCKRNLCFQSLDSLKRHLTRQARLIPERANAGASSKESSKNKRLLCGSSVPVFFRFLRRRKMPKAPHGCYCDTVGTILGHKSRLGPTTAHDERKKEWASTLISRCTAAGNGSVRPHFVLRVLSAYPRSSRPFFVGRLYIAKKLY